VKGQRNTEFCSW